MTKEEFKELSGKKTLLLDGAMGTNLMLRGMPKGVCTEEWLTEHPDIPEALLSEYAAAGSDIIYAPTFAANPIALARFGFADRTEEFCKKLVRIAKKASAGRCLIAGDLTMTGKADASYEELLDAYVRQISALSAEGVDLLAAETMMSENEATAACDAASQFPGLPLMVTMTVEADGSLLAGGNVFDCLPVFEAMGADAAGINCSVGPDQLESVIRGIREYLSIPVICKPNAGVPVIDEKGHAVYGMGPDSFAEAMLRLIDAGAGIVGGCCGTTPEYIKLLRERIDR
ncbi:MAG TPA: homocysteine S-methyltransferase family protein [Lachnospiraceae bacterium]|nr:homocysteine S-methyltransferase family protein [Lachnospiraceae bacterium]